MRYVCMVTFLILSLISSAASGAAIPEISPYKSLFNNEIPEYSPARLNISIYPKDLQPRLIVYKNRAGFFRSKLKSPEGPPERKMGFFKLVQVERGIVSLIDAKGIEDQAANYAKKAYISLEWEGMSDGPLAEAQFAESYLNQYPKSPLKPYLLLFLIHRYRIAYECLVHEKNFQKQTDVSAKYREYLKLAKDEKDPLVGFIADDIDNDSYLYIKTEKHP